MKMIPNLIPEDIAAIERATLAAVVPEAIEELDGWLLPFDSGLIGRAKSAVPLAHKEADPTIVGHIEARYKAHGLPAMFRLADVPCFHTLRLELARNGYQPSTPVLVQTTTAVNMHAGFAGSPAEIASAPDAGWAALFLGECIDPVDSAWRLNALSRANGSVYASVLDAGRTVAVGAGAFSGGWASVHGMRTDPAFRGRGLAGRVLGSLALAALGRKIDQVFLQVDESNMDAQALYRHAGFKTVWRYVYWRKP